MCDYSLQAVKSRPAQVGDRLRTVNFETGTRGFGPDDAPLGSMAVCVLPGTELAFDEPIEVHGGLNGVMPGPSGRTMTDAKVAIFRQINREHPHQHHDAVELPSGVNVLLTFLCEGQMATVLQLPSAPRNEKEAEEQRRVEYAG